MDSAQQQPALPAPSAPQESNAPESSTRRDFLCAAAATALVATAGVSSTSTANAAPAISAFAGRMNSPPSFYKQRAESDYRASMRPFGGQLATPAAVPTMPPNGTAGLPLIARQGNQLRAEFIRRKASTLPGITYTLVTSSSLTGWFPVTTTPTVTSIDATWERAVYLIPLDPAATRLFAQVQVQVP